MGFLVLFVLGAAVAPMVLAGGNDSCFGSLGCFSNKAPWSEPLRLTPPPQSPDIIDAKFYLYTRNALNRFVIGHPSDGVWDATGSDFVGSRKTIFVIHGFTQVGNETAINGIKDALLNKEDANVIVVDWGKGAAGLLNYLQVVSNTRVVGAIIAQLILHLKAQHGADESRIHLVGHSLGAHVAGYAGKRVPRLARITALDAAQPLFENYDPQMRLNQSDAVFVDAIHTDGKATIPLLGAGYVGVIGHVDFFVNGGWGQPGCLSKLWPQVTTLSEFVSQEAVAIYQFVRCSHDRSVEVFVASLNAPSCTFWGHQLLWFGKASTTNFGYYKSECTAATCSPMTYDSNRYPARGSFYVSTTGSYSYCIAEPKADAAMINAKTA